MNSTKVAPIWLQRVARICLLFGVFALVRLLFNHEAAFLWVGLALIGFGMLAPGLTVAFGRGVEEEEQP